MRQILSISGHIWTHSRSVVHADVSHVNQAEVLWRLSVIRWWWGDLSPPAARSPSVLQWLCYNVIPRNETWINPPSASPLFYVPSVCSPLHSPLCIPSSHVRLSPSPFQCPSLQFSSSLLIFFSPTPLPPLPSIGPKCDRNSNNTPQLCTNSLSLLSPLDCGILYLSILYCVNLIWDLELLSWGKRWLKLVND